MPGMAHVHRCPKTETQLNEATKRLRCGKDKYGHSQYICLPNKKKTSLVEFCIDGQVGIQEEGVHTIHYRINIFVC